MKLKLKTISECNTLIAQANELLGYPNAENGTLTYTDVPEITEVLDGESNIIDSYYEIEVSSEMLDQMLLIATEKLVEDTSTIDYEPEKRFEVKGKEKNYINLVFAVPDLVDYVKQSSITIYEEKDYRIFYVNSFLPNHREILTQYLGVESITDRQTNGN